MNVDYLRIVPPPDEGRLMPTRGTVVLTPDGTALPSVTKIELVAETNDIWRARIHCHVVVDGQILAQVMPSEPAPSLLDRIEAKLDMLLQALIDDDEPEVSHDLDGNELAPERDPGASLDAS